MDPKFQAIFDAYDVVKARFDAAVDAYDANPDDRTAHAACMKASEEWREALKVLSGVRKEVGW